MLLIEPVWNRNAHLKPIMINLAWTFNRTSMESKQRSISFVSIRSFTFNRTSMESKQISEYRDLATLGLLIEPVWNRNTVTVGATCSRDLPFNRTSMESKLESIRPRCPASSNLLIEPVWNRNPLLSLMKLAPFNRTMESKRRWWFDF